MKVYTFKENFYYYTIGAIIDSLSYILAVAIPLAAYSLLSYTG